MMQNTFRFLIGIFGTISLGGMGLNLFMMKVPPTEILNIHFLGMFMMVAAYILFVMTFWVPQTSQSE